MASDITELEELGAEKVSGVGTPANGTPWLLLKAEDTSTEADEIEDEMTKEVQSAVSALALLHDYAVKGVCTPEDLDEVQKRVDSLDINVMEKAKLKAKQRNALPDSAFAYIDPKGGRHLPIPDRTHVIDALARFNQTEFRSARAKAEAKAKIDAKAKELGIHVEKSPGVPAEATATPKGASRLKTQAQSKLAGPMTTGLATPPEDPSFFEGGQSTYRMPLSDKLTTNAKAPKARRAKRLNATKAWSLEVVDELAKGDATNWMSVENPPTEAEETDPGNGPWETYDAATLSSVATGLAAAMRAVDTIRKREIIEAVSGDPSDWLDAMKLDMASGSLADALGLIAALAYHEAAAVTKGAATPLQAVIDAATSHLPISGDEQQAAKTGTKTSEEDEIMTTVTKEELAKLVADVAQKSVKKSVRSTFKAQAKAIAKARAKAAKNANNGGDITNAEMEEKVKGHVDANDVGAVGGKVQRQFVNKSKKADKAIKQMESTIAELNATVAKMASRPRSGGPVLDGQARGSFGAAEGQLSTGVSKSVDELNIERLEKSYQEAVTSHDENAVYALGSQLTHARLEQAHLSGLI